MHTLVFMMFHKSLSFYLLFILLLKVGILNWPISNLSDSFFCLLKSVVKSL